MLHLLMPVPLIMVTLLMMIVLLRLLLLLLLLLLQLLFLVCTLMLLGVAAVFRGAVLVQWVRLPINCSGHGWLAQVRLWWLPLRLLRDVVVVVVVALWGGAKHPALAIGHVVHFAAVGHVRPVLRVVAELCTGESVGVGS